MEIQGIHILFTIIQVFLLLLTGGMTGVALLSRGEIRHRHGDDSGMLAWHRHASKYRSFYIGGFVLVLIFIFFQPIKMVPQSDGEREAIRQSFETPVYESNRPMNQASESSKSITDTLTDEETSSKEQWDKLQHQ